MKYCLFGLFWAKQFESQCLTLVFIVDIFGKHFFPSYHQCYESKYFKFFVSSTDSNNFFLLLFVDFLKNVLLRVAVITSLYDLSMRIAFYAIPLKNGHGLMIHFNGVQLNVIGEVNECDVILQLTFGSMTNFTSGALTYALTQLVA